MIRKTLYCFGDSWGAGAELDFNLGEKSFSTLLADEFGYNLINYSKENLSLGLIARELALHATKIQSTDYVLVVIPPDSRWYTEWYTLNYNASAVFYHDKTDDWFQYHHQLFIFTICKILTDIKCTYLLMHNYGDFPLSNDQYYFSKYYHDKFLSIKSLTNLLTNSDTDKTGPIEVEKNQGNTIFNGPYFEGKLYHPNQKGHIKIADLIKSKILF